MMNQLRSKIPALLLTLVVGLICSSNAFGAATIVIQNGDTGTEGFNDPTPATPVGGNNGTTVGQQRLIAFQYAASIWGATLTSGPTIVVRASWAALSCTARGGTLGSAGTVTLRAGFTNAPIANTWYGIALANALSGTDLNAGTPEITARFNSSLGTPGCLENSRWYYGLNTGHASNEINLVTVILHEFSHGLGFQSFTNEETGAFNSGLPGIYERFLFDNTTGKSWVQMTNSERMASAINLRNVVWTGQQVVGDAGFLINGKDSLGRPYLFTPDPLDDGSSVSHWDILATPNQLMEPNISINLSHNVTTVTTPQDLTYSLMRDIGWCSNCPPPPPPPPPPPAPANDNIAAAQLVSGCTGSVTGTNVSATHEAGEPSHSPDNNAGGGSVWYRWTAPSTGSVTMTTAGSNYDTLLAVYTGTSTNALTVVLKPDGTPAKNDDVDSGVIRTSTLTFNVTAGVTYKIAIDGWDGDSGNITFNWTLSNCSTAAPVVLTEEGTNRAVALDSVTQVRGPFPILGFFNFSVDQRTRVMLFTTNLGLNPGDESLLQVQVQGFSLPIERVGSLSGVNNGSYIIVKLVDQLPAGDLDLIVTLRGVQSNTTKIGIIR